MKRKIPIDDIKWLTLKARKDITLLYCHFGIQFLRITLGVDDCSMIQVTGTHSAILDSQTYLNCSNSTPCPYFQDILLGMNLLKNIGSQPGRASEYGRRENKRKNFIFSTLAI